MQTSVIKDKGLIAEKGSEVKSENLLCYFIECNKKYMNFKRNLNFILEFEFLFQLFEIKFNFLRETKKINTI